MYARALAHLESLRSDGPRLGLSSQGGSLMKRIARLLQTDPSRLSSRPIVSAASGGAMWRVGGAGAMLGVLIAASSAVALVKPPAQPLPEAPAEEVQEAEIVEVQGVPIMLQEGTWVMAQDAVQVEGEFVEADDAQSFAWQLVPAARDEAIVREGHLLRFAVHLDLACAPLIDPEHMPSDGLVHAAKLAYPFNLLQLMPWVAPEAHDVLIKPEMEVAVQPFLRLVERRLAATTLTLVPTVTDAQPINVVRHGDARVRLQSVMEGLRFAAIETTPAQPTTCEPVQWTIDFAPTVPVILDVVEGEGEWVEGVALPSKSVPAEAAKPAPAPKAEPAQPKP
jgi:hypothetical protein